MNAKPKPPTQTITPWLRANLGDKCMAGLTGTDYRALLASVQIVELYSTTSNDETATAFGLVVLQMQPAFHRLAYHAIAHVMDWGHRAELWDRAELPVINTPGRCQFE